MAVAVAAWKEQMMAGVGEAEVTQRSRIPTLGRWGPMGHMLAPVVGQTEARMRNALMMAALAEVVVEGLECVVDGGGAGGGGGIVVEAVPDTHRTLLCGTPLVQVESTSGFVGVSGVVGPLLVVVESSM